MRKTLITFFLTIALSAGSCKKDHDKQIDSLEDVVINGQKQKILIQGKSDKPLILYLHGGPGYSSILESQGFTDSLKQQSLFVQWDQRGTGYSYDERIDTTSMSMEQLIEDTKELTDYLLKRFDRDKLLLVGHSWGSALGFYTVEKYPERFNAFVGVGPVINRKEHIKARIDWVKEKMIEANDTAGLRQLSIDVNSNAGLVFQYGGFMHTMVNVDSITKSSPFYSESYTQVLEKGAAFSAKHIPEEEQNLINLTGIKSVGVPIYFFLGRFDQLSPTSFPVTFLEQLKAPDKKIIWFENSGHLMMLEESEKFQAEILRVASEKQ